MISVSIPGWHTLELSHLVLDLNGTIAVDGQVLPGVPDRLAAVSARLTVHLVTADTQGQAAQSAERLGLHLFKIDQGDAPNSGPYYEAGQKLSLVKQLGSEQTVAIGNGANDARMLAAAALGIAILGPEGLAMIALQSADIIVGRIEDALDSLLWPRRLIATLRR
jgi:P-type E1-E2 ATPase